MLTKNCDSFRIDHLFRIQLHFRDDMLFVIPEYSLHLGFWIVFVLTGNSLYLGSLQRDSVRHIIYCNFRRAKECRSLSPPWGFVITGFVIMGFVITGFHCIELSFFSLPFHLPMLHLPGLFSLGN